MDAEAGTVGAGVKPSRKPRKNCNAGDRAHMARVAELGCIVCFNLGRGYIAAEIHHLKTNPLSGLHLGLGQRASHKHTIPLCPDHHRGGHGIGYHGGPWEFAKRYGSEVELWEQVCRMLAIESD